MSTHATAASSRVTFRLAGRLPWRPIALAVATLIALVVGSTARHLAVPVTTGDHAVGRDRVVLVDRGRPETHTADPDDVRSVPVQLWYPAEAGTGEPAGYVDDLASIADGLAASGALSSLEVAGIRFVRTQAMDGATPQPGEHPVIVLSPGNETNVAFYASLAEDLASHGYLVVGVDHPFQVAATVIADGSVATYDHSMDAGDPATAVAAKVDERVADLELVLEALRTGDPALAPFAAMADVDRIGLMGHSNGGVTAFEVCRRDALVDACLNMDGQAGGGPLGAREGDLAPPVPFLFLTKETVMNPIIAERFEAAEAPAVRAVLPDAAHDSFTDGPLFEPGINPFTRNADRQSTTIRSMTVAFFDQWLEEREEWPYDGLHAPADLYINVYPLSGADPIPRP